MKGFRKQQREPYDPFDNYRKSLDRLVETHLRLEESIRAARVRMEALDMTQIKPYIIQEQP